jgi:hypothetical protein
MAYGYDQIYVERGGRIYTVEAAFTDEAHRGAHRQDSGGYRHRHRDLPQDTLTACVRNPVAAKPSRSTAP